jgi:O-succinylbenzoate synthase
MHIDSVELYLVSMPLLYPWRTAYGEDATIDSILVRMRSGEHSAWAESSPLAAPCYSPEWAVSAFALLEKWLAPAIVGQWVGSGEELQQKLSHFKGNQFAKAALDNAWWVLKAQSTGQPLYKLLGGTRDRFDVGADFGIMDNVGDLLDGVGKALAEGFPRVKLKFRPGWDVNMLRAIRREFPTQTFHIDCNSGYRLNEHLELFCRLDDFFLAMIEQPLAYDDVVDHARLQETIGTAICLDESINSVHRAEQAIELGSCRYINIKPARVGGLTNALAIHNLCREAGVPCWVGGMLESAVGASICIALATLDNFTYPADIFPSSRFYADDLGEPAITLTKSAAGVPQAVASSEPGIGATPNLERLERLCLKKAVIG